MTTTLTSNDISLLAGDRSSDIKISLAGKVVTAIGHGLSESAMATAIDVLCRLAEDIEVEVRAEVAELVASSEDIPVDLAERLAVDVSRVALPVLRRSPLLSDELLVAVVCGMDEAKQMAVAARRGLGESVSDALVDKGSESVVRVLVSNTGAKIAETTFAKALGLHGAVAGIADDLARRPDLPASLVSRLVRYVSDEVKKELVGKHGLSLKKADCFIRHADDRVTIRLLGKRDIVELRRTMADLAARGRLSETLLLRALCLGEMDIFLTAAAAMAGESEKSVGDMLLSDLGGVYEAALRKIGVSKAFMPAFVAALTSVRAYGWKLDDSERARYRFAVSSRMLQSCSSILDKAAAEEVRLIALDGGSRH